MCKAKVKLEAFTYILSRFVDYQREIDPASREKSYFDEKLCESFSNKRLMKLLYLLCLESVSIENNDIGLFRIFDNMIAYPNGPVEQDVYDSLGLIQNAQYSNGRFKELPNTVINLSNNELKAKIDDAFEKLKLHLSINDFLDRESLINIVHSLYLWSKTYISFSEESSENKKMPVDKISELRNEKLLYNEICKVNN